MQNHSFTHMLFVNVQMKRAHVMLLEARGDEGWEKIFFLAACGGTLVLHLLHFLNCM